MIRIYYSIKLKRGISMLSICDRIRTHNHVIVNEPSKGTYFVIDKFPSNYKVSGCINERPVNLRFTSETELWEFTENL